MRLQTASEHAARQQRIIALGLMAARRERERGGSAQRVAATITPFQRAAAQDAADSVPLMLDEQGIDPDLEGETNTAALVGVASDGRPLDTLVDQADTDAQFDMIVATQLADVARMAVGITGISARGSSGYIRMISPGACSRCAILSGKWFRWNEGFLRHPHCYCRHVPAGSEVQARADGFMDDPSEYFKSLSTAEQDRVFTQAGARAIRDGADMNQVVNARRAAQGLNRAGGRLTLAEQQMLKGGRVRGALERVDVHGQQVFITREGITTRGLAGERLGRFAKEKGQRYRTSQTPRLMPESIYEVAGGDREEALRLLRRFGYII